MQYPRTGFNPCVFHGLIYLSGTAPVMEVFSPEQDTLLLAQIPLPEQSQACCMYVDNDLLVLHSYQTIVKFEAGENGQLRQVTSQQAPPLYKWQYSQPVVERTRGVFFYNQEGKCVQVKMETGEELGRV